MTTHFLRRIPARRITLVLLCVACAISMGANTAKAQRADCPNWLFHDQNIHDAYFLYHNMQVLTHFTGTVSRYVLEHKHDINGLQNTLPQERDIFFLIVGKILNNEPAGERMALSFIRSPHARVFIVQMKFYLGVYYFHQEKYKEAQHFLEGASLMYLSNAQILTLKFYQAYTYFSQKQFAKAFVLFDAVRQVQKNNPLYHDATYYFAFLHLYLKKDYAASIREFRVIEKVPFYDNVVPYYIAYLMYLSKQRDEAIGYIQRSLQKKQLLYRVPMMKLLAHFYFENGDYAKTISEIHTYEPLQSVPLSREESYAMGFSYYQERQLDSAIIYLKSVHTGTTDTLFYNAMYNLGNAYLQLGRKEEARSSFVYCIGVDNLNKTEKQNAVFNYAKLSLELGFIDVALSTIKKYIEDYPSAPEVAEAKDILILCYASSNNYKEALRYIETSTSADARRLAGKIYYGRAVEWMHDDRADSAMHLFNKIIALPTRSRYYYHAQFWKAEILISRAKYQEAIKDLEICLNIPAEQMDETVNMTYIKYNMASVYFIMGNYKQALVLFSAILPPDKDNVAENTSEVQRIREDIRIKEADCYFILHKYDMASRLYKQVIALRKKYEDYASYQLALLRGIGKPEVKIKDLQNFLARYPASTWRTSAQMELAKTYLYANHHEEADASFNALLHMPNASVQQRTTSLLSLGIIALSRERYETALTYFHTLCDSYPGSPESVASVEYMKEAYTNLNKMDEFLAYINEKGFELSAGAEDSMYYDNIERRFRAHNYAQVRTLAPNYLRKFPQGYYKKDVFYLLARSLSDEKDYNAALIYCDSLLTSTNASAYIERASFLGAEISFGKLADYVRAIPYLKSLYASGRTANKTLAAQGLLGSYYHTQDARAGYLFVQSMRMDGQTIDANMQTYVDYFSAQNAMLEKNYAQAVNDFGRVVASSDGAIAAESAYGIAEAYAAMGKRKEAEEKAFETITGHGSYELWVTKSYLLLGDLYASEGDFFNAKATYKSIFENTQLTHIAQIAKVKYDDIIKTEQQVANAAAQERASMIDMNAKYAPLPDSTQKPAADSTRHIPLQPIDSTRAVSPASPLLKIP